MIIDENRRLAAQAVAPHVGPVRRRRSVALTGG
jgi:hypothetical protein